MTFSRFAGTLLLATVLSGCSSVPRIVNEYKIDVQQGNVLTQEMVSQLKPGLTKDQVRFILGTPVLADVFHANRWDYVYRLQKGNTGAVETRKFTAFSMPMTNWCVFPAMSPQHKRLTQVQRRSPARGKLISVRSMRTASLRRSKRRAFSGK